MEKGMSRVHDFIFLLTRGGVSKKKKSLMQPRGLLLHVVFARIVHSQLVEVIHPL